MSLARSHHSGQSIADDLNEQAQADSAISQEQAELAAYISEMAGELSKLAGRASMPMLVYFLNLARVEADMQARAFGGAQPHRQR